MEKKSSEEIRIEMDKAGMDAAVELKKVPKEHILAVAAWIKKHYLKAGYKRLCKALLAVV
jgi:hypothetical protein